MSNCWVLATTTNLYRCPTGTCPYKQRIFQCKRNPHLKRQPKVVLYSIVGIIGGMAYAPFYDTNENLFSKLSLGCTTTSPFQHDKLHWLHCCLYVILHELSCCTLWIYGVPSQQPPHPIPRNAGGSRLGQATVAAYPMLQNVTSIPVLAILIRCNLTLRNGHGLFRVSFLGQGGDKR